MRINLTADEEDAMDFDVVKLHGESQANDEVADLVVRILYYLAPNNRDTIVSEIIIGWIEEKKLAKAIEDGDPQIVDRLLAALNETVLARKTSV